MDAECPTDINGRIVVNPNSVLVCPATFTLDDDTNTNIQARVSGPCCSCRRLDALDVATRSTPPTQP